MTTYTIDKDALTVNLMRIVGIDKHQARECADVVLQMLAAPSTSPMTDQEISDVYFGATSQSLRPADMFVVRLFAHAVEARAKAIKGGA